MALLIIGIIIGIILLIVICVLLIELWREEKSEVQSEVQSEKYFINDDEERSLDLLKIAILLNETQKSLKLIDDHEYHETKGYFEGQFNLLEKKIKGDVDYATI